MTWASFALILFIVLAFFILCYLNFTNFSYFIENYFIFILLVVFIVLLFVVDFNNQVQITTYVKVTDVFATPLQYQVPYHSDTDITDVVNVSFTGTCEALGATREDRSVTNTVINFDIKSMAIGDSVTLTSNNDIGGTGIALFTITKTAEYVLTVVNTAASVDTTGKKLDGYLSLTLLCTGSQNIESGFKRLD